MSWRPSRYCQDAVCKVTLLPTPRLAWLLCFRLTTLSKATCGLVFLGGHQPQVGFNHRGTMFATNGAPGIATNGARTLRTGLLAVLLGARSY